MKAKRHQQLWTPDEVRTLKRYGATKTAEEVGLMLGRSGHSVANKASKAGISFIKRNENHHWTQYTDIHVSMVHCLLDGGFSVAEVHALTGRNKGSIKQLKYELSRGINQ